MYCEKCNVVFDGNVCPNCGNKKVREPNGKDLCFVVEKNVMWGEMLADVLKQHNIPFYHRSVLGAGLALKVGPGLERYRFYVPYSHLSSAQSLVDALFSSSVEGQKEPS